MTLLHRRIVYITFIIIFLIATPLIVLYTQGYRYNFQKGRVQKTGILKITSTPKKAEIWLNGIKFDSKETPAKIEYVLPGDYEIRLQKSGYYNWQKKLTVYENGTTFAENILLFKQVLPALISSTSPAAWFPSPDQRQLALASGTKLYLLEFNDGLLANLLDTIQEKISVYDLPTTTVRAQIMAWSPGGKKLLLSADDSNLKYYLVFDADSHKFQRIADNNYTALKWDQNNDNLLYAQYDAGLWQINISSGKISPALAIGTSTDYLIDGATIYYIQNGSLNISRGSNTNKLPLDGCDSCRITEFKHGRLILLDTINQQLKFIDPTGNNKEIDAPAKAYSWLNNDVLLFYNDWEIYIFDLNKKEPELITRLGQPITAACWHPQGRHIFFASDNKIKAIELDNRELRNILTLADNAAVKDLAINHSGKDLFFNGSYNGQNGIFKLNLQ